MNRRVLRTILFSAGLFLLALTASAATPDAASGTKPWTDEKGVAHSLDDFRGRITVVNFWATWCTPCRGEMPLLEQAFEKYSDRVSFVAISIDEEKARPQVWEFAHKQNLKIPVWIGGDTDHLKALAQTEALPATLFIDSDGKIVFRVQGAVDKKILEERLRWLTGDHVKKAPEAIVNTLKKHDSAQPLVPF